MPARSKISDDLKRQIVDKLMKGETTVTEAANEHDVHPYQIQAWVGQMTLGEGTVGRKYRVRPGGTKTSSASRGTGAAGDAGIGQILLDQLTGEHVETDDPLRSIGEWYVKEALKTIQLPKPGAHKPRGS